MSLQDFVFGRSEGERRARAALEDAEDRLLAYDESEALDLGAHAKRDADRMSVIVARQRNFFARFERITNRNWLTTILIGAALMAKGVFNFGDVTHAVARALGFAP